MNNKYNMPQDKPQMVSESIVAYDYASQANVARMHVMVESSNADKKDYLKANLHPTTAEHLESVDWMDNKPFPSYDNVDDETWIDEAEAMASSDIVDDETITRDRAAWQSLR